MKKVGGIVGLMLLLVACGTSKKGGNTYRCGSYDLYVTSYENAIDTTRAHISYCLYDRDDAVKKTADSIVKNNLLGLIETPDSLNTMPVDELFMLTVAGYFNSDYVKSISDGGGDLPPWSLDVDVSYNGAPASLLTFSISHYLYTGGAHPNGHLSYYNLEKKTGRLLHLKDVCTDIPELTRRAEVYFRRQQGLAEGEEYAEQGYWFENDRFHLNENFYFADGQLVFLYNQYEIAPYAMGVISCKVPLTELKDILRVDM